MPEKERSHRNYGDLVNGITYSIFLPVYGYLAVTEHERDGGACTVALFAWVTVWCWLSYWFSNWFCSLLAYCGGTACVVAMNLYEWPHEGEIVVLPQFFWFLMIATANQNLNFVVKACMGVIGFAAAIYVAVQSPLADLPETSPSLFGGLVVFLMYNYYGMLAKTEKGGSPMISARMALMILAGTFAHHAITELITMLSTKGYALTGGFSILKAGFFGAVGFAAAGSFKREIVLNESLSKLVEERAKEINRQAARLQMIGIAMEKSETAIAITDPNSSVLWGNAAMAKLAPGIGQAELEKQGLIHSLPMTDWDRSKLKSCYASKSAECDVRLHDKVFSVEVSPFSDPSGPRFVVAFKDVTEKLARERAEKKAEEESLLNRALTEAMEMLSHELRTPLQGIMGMTSLLLADQEFSQHSQEPLSLIMASSRLLLTLINNMLDIRKCDANMMESFLLSDQQAGPSIKEAVEFCRPIGAITNVELETSVESSEKVIVKINPVRLQQMIINLVSNAIKYSPKQATVTVSTSLMTSDEMQRELDAAVATGPRVVSPNGASQAGNPGVLCVCVRDQGAGIDKDGQKAIFKKFSQLKSKQENSLGNVRVGQPSGTGLGLNLCVKFASRMGGTMWVKNNADKGSSFCFYLPVFSNLPSQASPSPRKQPSFGSSRDSNSEHMIDDTGIEPGFHVLVVDDTHINLKVLRRMLERIGIKAICAAESGETALEALRNSERDGKPFDLVITDIQMPGMDGFELSQIITGQDGHTPIVAGLTAETSETLHKRADESGMVSILFKPITAVQLKHFITENLRSTLKLGI